MNSFWKNVEFTIIKFYWFYPCQASLCIAAMKEFMFGKGDSEGSLDDTDDEWEREQVQHEPNCFI